MKKRVLITGAAGRIGRYLTARWLDRYDLVLSDLRPPDELYGLPFIQADLADFNAVQNACWGVDTVVHLGADPRMAAPWDSLLPANIVGLYNLYEAAAEAECRRVVFASTVNVVAGYPKERQVHTHMPVRPLNLYGASKAWGEAVACFYADQKGLSSICLRFGWVVPHDHPAIRLDNHYLDMLLTYRDLERLVHAAVDAPPDLHFGIFHGVSDNRYKRLDISDARRFLGYAPEDDGFVLAEQNQSGQEAAE